jgi:hypothetical protein
MPVFTLVTVTAAFPTAAPVASWMLPIRLPSSYCALAEMPQNAVKRATKKAVQILCMLFMGATLQTQIDVIVNSR